MMDIKSQIAPKGLEFKSNQFVISDKYSCILTIISFPKFIYPGYLSSLTSMSGIKVVIKRPVNNPTKRFFVIAVRMERRRSPATFCKPSLIIFIPNRNTPSEPIRVMKS